MLKPIYRSPFAIIFLLFLICLSLLGYLPVWDAEFVNWDDADYVTENENIRSLSNWKAIFTQHVQGNYHPLTMFTLAFNYALSGLHPRSYHLFNLGIHIINVILTFRFTYLLSQKKEWLALFCAGVMAVHPIHVESVAWVTERKDVLYTCFFLAGLIQYLHYQQEGRRHHYLYTLLFFVLSLLSKPAAVVFPLVLWLLDYYKGSYKLFRHYIDKIPFLILALFMAWMTFHAQQTQGSVVSMEVYGMKERLFFACYGFMMYIVKLFYPMHFATFYPFPDTTTLGWEYYIAPFFCILLGVITVISIRKTKAFAFGLGFYGINLILMLQLVTVGSAVMADRYSYLSLLGIAWGVGWGIEWLMGKIGKLPIAILLVGIFVTLTGLCFQQAKSWQNSGALWDKAIEHAPSSRAYTNRALVFMDEKKNPEAIAYFSKSLELDPNDHETYGNRANVYYDMNEDEKALADYNKSIELDSTYHVAYDNRSALFNRMGKTDEAMADLNHALVLQPDYDPALYNRGVTHMNLGENEWALRDFQRYLTFKPRNGDVWNSVGVCYQSLSKHDSAIVAFNQAIRIKELGVFYLNCAISYKTLEQPDSALRNISKAHDLGAEISPELMEEVLALKK